MRDLAVRPTLPVAIAAEHGGLTEPGGFVSSDALLPTLGAGWPATAPRVGGGPSVVCRLPAHLVVGLGQGFGEEGAHMAAAQAVDHAAPVAGGFHQAGE